MVKHVFFSCIPLFLLALVLTSCDEDSPTSGVSSGLTLTKIAGDNQIVEQGDTLAVPLTVLASDADGIAVEDRTIEFKVIQGEATLLVEQMTTDRNGRASVYVVAGSLQGLVRVQAKLIGDAAVAVFTVIIGVHTPAVIEIVSGNGQGVNAGEILPEPLCVIVKDYRDRPYEGAEVRFEVTLGYGMCTTPADTTGTDGIARTRFAFMDSVGATVVTASVQRIDVVLTTQFKLTAIPLQFGIISGVYQTVSHGETYPKDLKVRIRNINNNGVPDVPVTFSVEGDVMLSETLCFTDESGIAQTTATAGNSFGDITVTASAPGTETPLYFNLSISSPTSIAFIQDAKIYTMNTNGTNVKCITVKTKPCYSPSWSPDCTKIAYMYGETPNGVYILDLVTGKNSIMKYAGLDPSWSPDGTEIAYWSFGDKVLTLNIINPDATNNRPIYSWDTQSRTMAVPTDMNPSWSPDGQEIVFSKEVRGTVKYERGIYKISIDGAGLTQLRKTGMYPVFSPDGSKILFVDNDLYIMNPDGSGEEKILETSLPIYTPTWSPDSYKIAFSTAVNDYQDELIYIVNRDGSDLTLIRRGGRKPVWSPGNIL